MSSCYLASWMGAACGRLVNHRSDWPVLPALRESPFPRPLSVLPGGLFDRARRSDSSSLLFCFHLSPDQPATNRARHKLDVLKDGVVPRGTVWGNTREHSTGRSRSKRRIVRNDTEGFGSIPHLSKLLVEFVAALSRSSACFTLQDVRCSAGAQVPGNRHRGNSARPDPCNCE